MDASTDELRRSHDQIAELYAEKLADALDSMPQDRAVLDLFCELVRGSTRNRAVGDVGCGTGRLERYLARRGMQPRGVDLSPEMVRVARRDYPEFSFEVGDVRDLPFADASLAGVVCWYSLMYLAPEARPVAFGELARVLEPGGYLTTAFKLGDDRLRRGGARVGVAFDIYWLSHEEVSNRLVDAGFSIEFSAQRPAAYLGDEQPQGYLIARKV